MKYDELVRAAQLRAKVAAWEHLRDLLFVEDPRCAALTDNIRAARLELAKLEEKERDERSNWL